MKIIVNCLGVLTLSLIMMGCSRDEDFVSSSFSVVSYKNVGKNYKFDYAPLLEHNDKYYVHKDSLVYNSSNLTKAYLYKSEGVISWPIEEMTDVEKNKKLYFKQGVLYVEGKSYSYEKIRNNVYLCQVGKDDLFIYYIIDRK